MAAPLQLARVVLVALALAVQTAAPAAARIVMAGAVAAGARCAPLGERGEVVLRHGEAPDRFSAVCADCALCGASDVLAPRSIAAEAASPTPIVRAFARHHGFAPATSHRFAHRARAPPGFPSIVVAVAAAAAGGAEVE